MSNFLKRQWQKITSIVLIPAAFAAGTTFDEKQPVNFDTKGQDIKFCVDVKKPNFSDRICYGFDEWNNKSQGDMETEADARFSNWQNIVTTQSVHTPTKAELQEQIDLLNQSLDETTKQYNDIP